MRVRFARAFVAAILIVSVLITATPAHAAVINSPGPLTQIITGNQLSCEVRHRDDGQGVWFNSSACGTFIATGGTLYGPSFTPGTSFPRTGYSAISSTQSGQGTIANPFVALTSVILPGVGVTAIQTDTYITGNDFYTSTVQITNNNVFARSLNLYTAGNCFLQDSDNGYGQLEANKVGCKTTPTGNRTMSLTAGSAGAAIQEGSPSTIWNVVGSQGSFNNTCNCDSYHDNAIGLNWVFSLGAGGSTSRSWTTTVTPKSFAPVNINVSADAPLVAAGGTDGYRIQVNNPNSTGVLLQAISVTLPPSFTYIPGSTTGFTTNNPNSVGGGTIRWDVNLNLPAASTATMHFAVNVGQAGGTFAIDVVGQAQSPNSVTPALQVAPVTVGSSTDLSVTDSVAPTSAHAGDRVVYTITVMNTGPATAMNVVLSERLPFPGGVAPGCTTVDTTITCPLGTMGSGTSVVTTITAVVPPNHPPGTYADLATVSSATADTNPNNNSAAVGVVVDRLADLSIATSIDNDTLIAGDEAVYTITVTNNGPSDARNVVMVLANPTVFAATSVDPAPACGSRSTSTCSFPLLASGASVAIIVTGTLHSSVPTGTALDSVATVSSDEPDTNTANNTVNIGATSATSADVSIAATGPAALTAGTLATFTVQLSNAGLSAAHDVVVPKCSTHRSYSIQPNQVQRVRQSART